MNEEQAIKFREDFKKWHKKGEGKFFTAHMMADWVIDYINNLNEIKNE